MFSINCLVFNIRGGMPMRLDTPQYLLQSTNPLRDLPDRHRNITFSTRYGTKPRTTSTLRMGISL